MGRSSTNTKKAPAGKGAAKGKAKKDKEREMTFNLSKEADGLGRGLRSVRLAAVKAASKSK
jgi:hypothetical protein